MRRVVTRTVCFYCDNFIDLEAAHDRPAYLAAMKARKWVKLAAPFRGASSRFACPDCVRRFRKRSGAV